MTDRTADLASPSGLAAWLGDRLPGVGTPDVRRVTSGHSNELFAVSRGGVTVMLRRPPRVLNAPTAHDMGREHRVLTALTGSTVPHAAPRGFCSDVSVIGAPFFLAEEIDGIALYECLPSALEGERRAVGFALVDALAALHAVDWVASGLADFGRPDGYSERQAHRWSKQLRSYSPVREIPELDEVGTWIGEHCPGTSGLALIHGDYGLHNVLFAHDAPARALAVVDWETATIGDPLADLGYLLADWLEPAEFEQWGRLGPPCGMAGYPSRAEMLDRYSAATGRGVSVEEIVWYRVLGQFKIAVILEGSYGRHQRGESDDPFFASLEERVPLLARHALAIARGEA
ncbi:MAG: phosphotransferase family protein [Acidimicrobiia bacterium]